LATQIRLEILSQSRERFWNFCFNGGLRDFFHRWYLRQNRRISGQRRPNFTRVLWCTYRQSGFSLSFAKLNGFFRVKMAIFKIYQHHFLHFSDFSLSWVDKAGFYDANFDMQRIILAFTKSSQLF
jgi:hypothetical protein